MAQPKITIERTQRDTIIDMLTYLGLAIMVGLTADYFQQLPDTIPVHFDGSGNADGYGGKGTIWVIPIIVALIAIGFSYLERIPHHFNYSITVTPDNAEKQYRIGIRLLQYMKLIIAWSFLYLQYRIIQAAVEGQHSIGNGFLVVFLALIFGGIVYFVYLSYKKPNKKD